MNAVARNFLLSALLIAIPAGGFALTAKLLLPDGAPPAPAQAPRGLGDLSAYQAIVGDTRSIVATGDLAGAERRITDLESLWDVNAASLRQADAKAWAAVDAAADQAFAALRAKTPDPVEVSAALANLGSMLASPVISAADQPLHSVAGIPVTDTTGRALPCEDLLGQLRGALAGKTPTAEVADLQSKAVERCNADDDARADAFAAQALSQIKG
jgi:hypothetical protein